MINAFDVFFGFIPKRSIRWTSLYSIFSSLCFINITIVNYIKEIINNMFYLIPKSQMEMSKVPSGVIYLKSSLCFFNLSAWATNLFVALRGITSYIENFFTRIYRATNKLYSYVLNNFNTANNIIKLISKYKFGICLILFNLLIIGSIIRF